jgi:2-keto-4-pentenoate hydratase
LGGRACGWKIGATSELAQRLLNADGPFAAPLFAEACHGDGAELAVPGHGLLGLEAEFAMRLGADLPARAAPYDAAEVALAVASVHPAFEVIGLRLPVAVFTQVAAVIADFGANVALVAGTGVADWRAQDLAALEVEIRVDGAAVGGVRPRQQCPGPSAQRACLARQCAQPGGPRPRGRRADQHRQLRRCDPPWPGADRRGALRPARPGQPAAARLTRGGGGAQPQAGPAVWRANATTWLPLSL